MSGRLLRQITILAAAGGVLALVVLQPAMHPRTLPGWAALVLMVGTLLLVALATGDLVPGSLERAMRRLRGGREDPDDTRAWDQVIDRFDGSADPRDRLATARTMAGKASALWEAGGPARIDRSVAVHRVCWEVFADDADPAMRPLTTQALYFQALGLHRLGCDDEALAVLHEAIAGGHLTVRPGDDDRTISLVGWCLLLRAELQEGGGRHDPGGEEGAGGEASA